MADGRGGYRRPTNPAPVSGPGALSKRTDGKQPRMTLPNAQYGEAANFDQIQAGAAIPQAGSLSAPTPQTLAGVTQGLTPLSAPSQQPGTPVTDGAALGPGAGPSALNLPSQQQQNAQDFRRYLPVLLDRAQRDGTPQSFKNLVRQLIASL